QAEFSGKGERLGGGGDWSVAAGDQRRADDASDVACLKLVAQRLDDFRVGTDPGHARVDDGLRELGPLRQEAVARMDGIRAGALRDVDRFADVEIGLAR